MVYCTSCGTKNEDDANICVKCGAALSSEIRRKPSRGERPRTEDECFGLPRGGAIFGLFLGIIIIFVGLQQVFGWSIDVGPFAAIIFGLLVIAGAVYGFSRRRG